ncbi:MAG: ankyrin repeat domain-containing protein [Longimicrobiales bacterium]
MANSLGNKISLVTLLLILFTGSIVPADSPIADAAMRNDSDAVYNLLERGEDVNAAQGDGMTALHWSAENGDLAMVEVLLSAGANFNSTTRLGSYTPLHLASKMGHGEVIRALLGNGQDPNITAISGMTPLHYAAASGSADAVDVLVGYGAQINAKEDDGKQTPLMFAAALNRIRVVEMLTRHGADLEAYSRVVDMRVRGKMDRVAGDRRNEVISAFRQQTAEGDPSWRPNTGQVQTAVKAANAVLEQGPEAFAEAEEGELLDGAVAAGVSSFEDLVGGHGGFTALVHAVREGHVESAQALLHAGANINAVTKGDSSSPLLMAMINGHFDLGLFLVSQGADVNLASAAGTTPLYAVLNVHWAPKARYPQPGAQKQQNSDYLETMETLLKEGANPNVRLKKHIWYMGYTFDQLRVNTTGATPFWRAAYGTDVSAMKLLVAYGAESGLATMKVPGRRRGPVREDLSGLSPLADGDPAVYPIHAASGVGYGESFAGQAHRHVPDGWMPSIRYLVEELGADVNARDANGFSPVHHAAARGDNELILYLVEKGADVTLVGRSGQTTVDMANGPFQRIQPFPETMALLEGMGAVNNHNCVSC